MKESHFRSVIKGLIWRVIGSTITMSVVFAMTGDLAIMASIGIVDIVAQLFFYYIHERTWGKIQWGILGIGSQARTVMKR